ncbi:hypothetical protein [Sphingobacterium sp.]|uniref:hypothetical protein n=1 Tax=Sphingobacterium sp. TaxID=341027 RepID=UPI0028AFD429|nr:hypothetical protein [Sphingobacterium sp.]
MAKLVTTNTYYILGRPIDVKQKLDAASIDSFNAATFGEPISMRRVLRLFKRM